MFASWSDAVGAVLFVVGVTTAVRVFAITREGAWFPSLRSRPTELPANSDDGWMNVIGQRRSDAERRRRASALVVAGVLLAQIAPISPVTSGLCLLAGWLLLHYLQEVYDRLQVLMIEHDDHLDDFTSLDLLKGVSRSRASPFAGVLWAMAAVSGALSIFLAITGWLGMLAAADLEPVGIFNPLASLLDSEAPIWIGLAGLATVVAARLPMQSARRIALGRFREGQAHTALYLRSFKDDRLRLLVHGFSRGIVDRLTMRHTSGYEQLLVGALRQLGPVVAIGEPGERLPPLGAFRRYYADHEWQSAVEQMLKASNVIVLSLGATPSVEWEIEKIRELGLLQRAIFLVPPVDPQARQARLRNLADLLGISRSQIDRESAGVEILAVVMRRGLVPTLLTSAIRDYAGYGNAVLSAAFDSLEIDEQRTEGGPGVVTVRSPTMTEADLIDRKRIRLKWLQNRERELERSDPSAHSLDAVRAQIATTQSEIVAMRRHVGSDADD